MDENWMTIAEAAARVRPAGVAAYALDPEAAERLWTVSQQMNQ